MDQIWAVTELYNYIVKNKILLGTRLSLLQNKYVLKYAQNVPDYEFLVAKGSPAPHINNNFKDFEKIYKVRKDADFWIKLNIKMILYY